MSDVPHVYGNDCLLGFPAGKTPLYIYIRFSELIKCPNFDGIVFMYPPNDRVFTLTQDDINPCKWLYEDDNWGVLLIVLAPPGLTELYLYDRPFNSGYFHKSIDIPLDEGPVHYNDYRNCVWNGAHDGMATLTWTHEATDLLAAINMQRADDLFMEMRPLVDGNKVYKFCRLRDATNIKIELEPD